jgi:hypothetical protein
MALALLALLSASASAQWKPDLTRPRREALDRISADSLRGHLSFIASDLLEGRGTPSRGLNVAAEYIAAQFRRAGLEPGNAGSYFQTTVPKIRGTENTEPASNVVGVLRGSDEALRDTYIVVSAHYDHLGIRRDGEGDRIFNGANDDGSGTVSVMELASAISSMKERPKRSVIFMTFFGEERGMLGSTYYGQHPLFPLEKTVAMINLEHMGRTDDTEGPRLSAVVMTGFDYSDVGSVFAAAGKATGIEVGKHPRNSDAFFVASDNIALAALGIPAHTLCTTFIFPDYHKVSDHWEKVDFSNMASTLRAVALGIMTLADSPREPRWRETNPKAAKFLEAWKARKGPAAPP